MDIKSYLAILKGNIWVILLTVIAAVAAAAIITFTITPVYTASTTLRIATASSGAVSYSDYIYADRLINTYIRLAISSPVKNELARKLNLQNLPEINVVTIPNTELIKITTQSPDPLVAQNSANSLADILIAQGNELLTGGGKSARMILSEQLVQAEEELNQARQEYDAYVAKSPNDTVKTSVMKEAIQLKENTYVNLLDLYEQARLKELIRANIISIVEPAVLPAYPSKPNKLENIGLGLIIGLVGGIGLAFLFENLGTRLYSSKQIEAVAGLNLIGKIPAMPGKRLGRLWKGNYENINNSFIEAFHRLNIQFFSQNQNMLGGSTFKTILITSSIPDEGKSTITINFAKTIAQSGKKVIVVDCDMHRPKQHILNGVPNDVGLSNIFGSETNFNDFVKATQYPNLYLLTSGPLPVNPNNLLATSQMKNLLTYLSSNYDMVLLDTPALLAITDTSLLIPLVDGVMFVARRNVIREDAIRDACQQLRTINSRQIGLVVNDAERIDSYYYSHHS